MKADKTWLDNLQPYGVANGERTDHSNLGKVIGSLKRKINQSIIREEMLGFILVEFYKTRKGRKIINRASYKYQQFMKNLENLGNIIKLLQKSKKI